MPEPPLTSPKNQQANASIRGYSYQHWLTVEAWLKLGSNELLYVETAEDFAKFAPGTADIAQAKDLSSNLTLRSESIIDSINHFFQFRKQNSAIKICFSLLTTAAIGVENGGPFGDNAGLTVWQELTIKPDNVRAEQLRTFLVSDASIRKRLDAEVVAFLEACDPLQFIEEVLRPITWDVAKLDSAGVRASVEGQLRVLIERHFAASASHAANLADTLFTAIETIAGESDRPALTAADLLTTIERHLAPSRIEAAVAQAHEALGGAIAGATKISPTWAFSDLVPAIATPPEFSSRESAIRKMESAIAASPFALFEGSTGMGKSTLAQIISKNFGGSWLFLRAGDIELSRTIRALEHAMVWIARDPQGVGLIIDDLPWEKLDGGALNVLRGLAWTAIRRNARMLFANQRAPAVTVTETAGLTGMVIVRAPSLETEEVVEIAEKMGCPRDLALAWSKLSLLQTSGHPRLVHAHLIGLRSKGWPPISAEEFEASNDRVRQARDNVQTLLADRRAEELDLLTRLSVFFGFFRRDHALAIAVNPGAPVAFANLLGPWIESVGNDRYRLSPLLAGTLLRDHPAGPLMQLHTAAARAIVASQPMEVTDAANALLNALAGRSSNHATGLILSFLTAPKEQAASLHALLAWAPYYPLNRRFPDFPAVDFLFRALQFEVSTTIAPGKTRELLANCDELISEIGSKMPETFQVILALSIIKVDSSAVPLQHTFWACDVLRDAMAANPEIAAKSTHLLSELGAQSASDGVELMAVLGIWMRLNSPESLRGLLNELIHASDREKFTTSLLRAKAAAVMAFDRVWLNEHAKPESNWGATLSVFSEFMDAALTWGVPFLAACAARGLSIIHNEYLANPTEALKFVERVVGNDPQAESLVLEQRGKVALLAKDYPTAQRYFEEAIPQNPWRGLADGMTGILHRNAGVSAGHAGDWNSAQLHFATASKIAADEGNPVQEFALLADAAFAEWKAGRKQSGVAMFQRALELVTQLPDRASDLASYRAQKVFGHVISRVAWGEKWKGIESSSDEVLPGMCSEDRLDEQIRKLPMPPQDLVRLMILSLRFDYTPGDAALGAQIREQRSSPLSAVRPFALELEARWMLKAGDYVTWLQLALDYAAHMASIAGLKDADFGIDEFLTRTEGPVPSGYGLNGPFPVPIFLLCGLTAAYLNDVPVGPILARWREDATHAPIQDELIRSIDTLTSAFTAPRSDSESLAASSPDEWVRWVHALKLVKDPSLHPQPLFIATVFLTLSKWPIGKFGWLSDTISKLDHELSRRWLRACEMRFAFRTPTLFIPDIKYLAANPDGTQAHLASLVVAAEPALDVRIGRELMDEIRSKAIRR